MAFRHDDGPSNEELVAGLIRLLTVEKRRRRYLCRAAANRRDRAALFGGQVLAQALQAAQASIADAKCAHFAPRLFPARRA